MKREIAFLVSSRQSSLIVAVSPIVRSPLILNQTLFNRIAIALPVPESDRFCVERRAIAVHN
ncbi:hypothetical protein JYQ62_32680 [Nostoc sp. UHCC 0702]|nr:hypothetical protein JYQ62_32680 [Nostoc sp. UHCC 0702]